MMQFTRILVPLSAEDGGVDALLRAGEVAKAAGAAITVVDVAPGEPVTHPRLSPPPWVLPSEVAERKTKRLEELVRPVRDAGVHVEIEVLFGKAYVEVVRKVIEGGYDLLLTNARGGDSPIGTLAMRLMRKCPCPVWVVKPGSASRSKRVLAALDAGAHDPNGEAVTRRVLELARTIAQQDEAELHVLYAWTAIGEDMMKGYYRVPHEKQAEYAAQVSEYAQRSLREFLRMQEARLDESHVHCVQGMPAAAIIDFVREHDIDQLVMGTVARGGIPGMLMGNTAERVLSQVDCSLAAIKPDDFVSPIKASHAEEARKQEEEAQRSPPAKLKVVGGSAA